MADSEIYRVEIPIIVNDQTEAPFRKAEERVSRFQRNAEKSNRMVRDRMLSLAKLQVEPVMKVRDQLTNSVMKADKLIKRLGAEKASPVMEAQDRVSAVVTRINAALKALDKGDVKVLAEMKGPLMDEIVKAKSSLVALNNVKSGPVAELRGELFGQLSKAQSQLRNLDRFHVEPTATLRERVAWKAREISGELRRLTSRAWTVVINVKDRALGKIKGIFGALNRLTGLLMLGAGGGIGGLTKLGIDMVVERENITMAFETLLGSVDAAKKRIEELDVFARKTPFLRDEIYEASRILEVFTRGALSTGKGLRLVGDIASGTGNDFKDVALWMGRLYDAMASGRPIGEMTARLQEMGAISGSGRAKLEQLAKSGKKISEIWPEVEKVFARFEGQMESMSTGLGNMLTSVKSFFRETVLLSWGKGIEAQLRPVLEKFREWRNEHPEQVQAIADKIQRIAETGAGKVVEFFERAFGRIAEVIESPEFDNATFGEKVRMLVEAGLEDVITWLEGPGMKKLEEVFLKLGEASFNAYLSGMRTLGEKTVENLKEGNIKGAAVSAGLMWMLGGGALLKGGWSIGKGLFAGGKKVVQSKPVRGLAKGARKALVGEDLLQASKSAGVATQTTTRAAKNTTKAAAETAKATKRVVRASKGASTQAAKTAGKLGFLKGAGKTLGKGVGRAALPVAIGLEAYDIAKARDKTKATAKAGGGLAGAALGAKGGAALGTMVLPGVGTVIGGVLGGAGGYLAGSFAGGKAVDATRGAGAKPAYAAEGGGASTTQYLNQEVYEPFREQVNRAESWGRNLIGNFMRGRDSAGMSMGGWLNNKVYEPFREYVNRAESWGRNLIGNFMRGRDSKGMSMRGWLNNLLYEPFREYVNRAESWGRNLIGNFMRGRDSAGMSMTGWLNNKVYEPFRTIVNRAEPWGRNLIGNFMRGRDSAGMSMSGWLNSQVYEPFRSIVNRAESWGRNMMKNFVKGMQQVPIPAPKVPAPVYSSSKASAPSATKHAAGGILSRPHLGLVAEAGPEAIIPLSAARRSRALALWEETGRRLGVSRSNVVNMEKYRNKKPKAYAEGGFAGRMQHLPMAAGSGFAERMPVMAPSPAWPAGGSNINIVNNVSVSIERQGNDNNESAPLANAIADTVADKIAYKISGIFGNMPLRS